MGKHRKKLDFQKVKLKVGRHIRKGVNLTDPKFKAKKIVLQEQLKQYADQPTEKRTLLPADIIKGLNPLNSSRTYFLQKAKDFLNSKSEDVLVHVSNFLRKACGFMIDREADVRKAALAVIHTIFCLLSKDQMEPFYPLLRSYVSCGATHINSAIRNDSLLFLDLILEFFPDSLCDSSAVFNNFLDLISHRCEETSRGNRRLISTPSEKITAQEWRIKVLQRLTKFLDVNIAILQPDEDESSSVGVDFDEGKYNIAIKRHFNLEIKNMLTFSLNKTEMLGDDVCSTSPKVIEDFIDELMQLLIDTWKEAVPTSLLSPEIETLSKEAPVVMMTVIKVIYRLAQWVNLLCSKTLPQQFMADFKEESSKYVSENLLMNFPFSVSCPYKKPSKNDSMSVLTPVSEFGLNVEVSKIYALVVLGTTSCFDKHHKNVLDYLLAVIKRKNLKQLVDVVEVIKLLLREGSFEDCDPHLRALFNIYKDLENERGRRSIRNLFMSLVLDVNFRMFFNMSVIQMWLEYIPSEFICMVKEEEEIDKHYLSQLKRIASRRYPVFVEAVERQYSSVIKVLQVPDKDVQELAVMLITRIRNFTPDVFRKLAIAIRNSVVTMNSVRNIMFELIHRVKREKYKGFSFDDLLSFLFNVSMGVSANEEDKWISKESEMFQDVLSHSPAGITLYTIIPSTEWSRHKDIHSVSMSVLHQLPKIGTFNACVESFLKQFLSSIDHIPLHTAAAILDLYTDFIPGKCMDNTVEQLLANLTLSFYMYEIIIASICSGDEVRMQYSLLQQLMDAKKNITQIINVIYGNRTCIRNFNIARVIGGILIQVIDTETLTKSDVIALRVLVHNFTNILGPDIVNEDWYKDIEMYFSPEE